MDKESAICSLFHNRQTTINEKVSFCGEGLHTGSKVRVECRPAEIDTGIRFVRSDLLGSPSFEISVQNVVDTVRSTSLGIIDNGHKKVEVHTAEHLLASLGGLGIDNIEIVIDNNEVPIMDGSASIFAEGFSEVGLKEQNAARTINEISRAIWSKKEDMYLIGLPYEGFKISYTLVYEHSMVGTQFAEFDLTPEIFICELAPARTFGFMEEIDYLKKEGLGKGGSLDNVIMIDEDSILTSLRFPDELVRHKILDIIGDMTLAGPFRGHIIAIRSGHALHVELAHMLCKEFNCISND